MTQRERLVELLEKADDSAIEEQSKIDKEIFTQEEFYNYIADYLLENGVIVPPCKVGDTVYRCGDPIKKTYEWEIEHIEIYADETVFVDDSDNVFSEDDINKTVFLTKEEAEKALAERIG